MSWGGGFLPGAELGETVLGHRPCSGWLWAPGRCQPSSCCFQDSSGLQLLAQVPPAPTVLEGVIPSPEECSPSEARGI